MNISDIKSFLKNHKITYEELSKRSNIPIGTLKSIFSGRTPNPRVDTLLAIEQALGIENEKKSVMERPTSELAENFIKEFGDLFSDKTFHAYAELYRFMDEKQKIFIVGMIVGYLQDQGKKINIKF